MRTDLVRLRRLLARLVGELDGLSARTGCGSAAEPEIVVAPSRQSSTTADQRTHPLALDLVVLELRCRLGDRVRLRAARFRRRRDGRRRTNRSFAPADAGLEPSRRVARARRLGVADGRRGRRLGLPAHVSASGRTRRRTWAASPRLSSAASRPSCRQLSECQLRGTDVIQQRRGRASRALRDQRQSIDHSQGQAGLASIASTANVNLDTRQRLRASASRVADPTPARRRRGRSAASRPC